MTKRRAQASSAPAPEADSGIVVDARGHRCPVPTLRLQRALRHARPGSTATLLADDPLARIDVPHFAAQKGIELVEVRALEGGFEFRLRVPGP